MQAMLDAVRAAVGSARTIAVERGDPRYAPHPTPLVHALPHTREEAVALVAAAARDGFAIVPVGGNTAPRVGRPDEPPFCLLSTEHLDRTTAYEPGDQTLTVEAGISIATVQALVARDGLRLAFSPADPERATVGGVYASAEEGQDAAADGLVRDQVLGVEVVTGDGVRAKAGGRVVKNVTGYDLVRLYAGSRGALALVLEMTLRLRPLPEAAFRAIFPATDEAAALEKGLLLRRKVGGLRRLFVLGGAATAEAGLDAPWAVIADAAGFATAARAAMLRARDIAGDGSGPEAVAPTAATAPFAPDGAAVLRVTAPPAEWPALSPRLGTAFGAPAAIVHDVLRGVRETWHDAASRIVLDDAVADRVLVAAGATLDLPRDPGFHRDFLRRFPGQTPGGLALMRELKKSFDPRGVLNPGRTIFG